jgi:acyl-coenzyme A synthetase/AMP-(fatty) acid ligase
MGSSTARQTAGTGDRQLMGNLFHQIERVATARRDATAFECPDLGSFTFTDLLARSAAFGHVLTSLGVSPGDRVTVQLEKSIDAVWLYLAVLRVGAIYMPLNSGYTDAEMEYFIADAQPTLIVVEPQRLEAVDALASKARREQQRSRRSLRAQRQRRSESRRWSVRTTTSPRSCTRRGPPAAPRER